MGSTFSHEELYYKINKNNVKDYYSIYDDKIKFAENDTINPYDILLGDKEKVKEYNYDLCIANNIEDMYTKIGNYKLKLSIIENSIIQIKLQLSCLGKCKDHDFIFTNRNNKDILIKKFKFTENQCEFYIQKSKQWDKLNFSLLVDEANYENLSKIINDLYFQIEKFKLPNYKQILQDWDEYKNDIFIKYKCININTKLDDDYVNFLSDLGIQNKRDWYVWLKKNHPDKNNDTSDDLCSKVINYGKILFK